MFYVSISSSAIEKIKEHAGKNPDKEVIGLLIGRMEGNTLIIEDTVTGEIVSEKTKAILTPETIAKIADEIVSGKIKGSIIGWYHSHPGFGVFMSEIDIKTQMKMQQFSPYIVALIIDPTKNEIGFFTVDTNTRSPIMLTEDLIHIYAPGEEPIPQKFRYPLPQTLYKIYSLPSIEIPQKPGEKGRPPKKPKVIFATIAIITMIFLLVALLYTAFLIKSTLEVTISPGSVTTFVDFPVNINVFINGGTPEYNCTWYLNGSKLDSVKMEKNQDNYTLSLKEKGAFFVYANVTDKKGNVRVSKNITITVLPLPVIIDNLLPKNGSRIIWGEKIPINGTLKSLYYDKIKNNYYLMPLSNALLTIKYLIPQGELVSEIETKITTKDDGFFEYVVPENHKNFTGKLNVDIIYKGSEKFNEQQWNLQIELIKRDTRLTIDVHSIQDGVEIKGKLQDTKGLGLHNAIVQLEYYNVTNNRWEKQDNSFTIYGDYSFKWNPKPGNYTIRTAFCGSNLYTKSVSEEKIVGPKIHVKIDNITSLNVPCGTPINFTITLNNTGLLYDEIKLTFLYKRPDDKEWSSVPIKEEPLKIEALKKRTENFTWNTEKVNEGLYNIRVKADYSFEGCEIYDMQINAIIEKSKHT